MPMPLHNLLHRERTPAPCGLKKFMACTFRSSSLNFSMRLMAVRPTVVKSSMAKGKRLRRAVRLMAGHPVFRWGPLPCFEFDRRCGSGFAP